MISNMLHFQGLPLTRHLGTNVWLLKMDEYAKRLYLICQLLRTILNLKMTGQNSQVKKLIFQVICLTTYLLAH